MPSAYNVPCTHCGKLTTKAFSRRNQGKCKHCVSGGTEVQGGKPAPRKLAADTLKKTLVEGFKSLVSEDAWRRAREARFSTSASLLSGVDVTVDCTNNPALPVACWNSATKRMLLNSFWPVTDNPVLAQIFDRAKLYHELGHTKFTTNSDLRGDLQKASKAPDKFLNLSNVLEDGRIERKLREIWAGAGDYLDAIVAEVAKDGNQSPLDGLILHVRYHVWRNESERKFWEPFQADIDRAVQSESSAEVWRIAADITEKLFGEEAKHPDEQKADKPTDRSEEEPEDGQSESEESSGDAPQLSEDGQGEADEEQEGEDSGEGSGEASEGDGEGEGEEDEEGEEGKEGDSPADSRGGKQQEPAPEGFSEKAWKEVQKIVREAMDEVSAEALADVESMIEEVMDAEPVQDFLEGSDEGQQAEILAEVFRCMKTESARVRSAETRSGVLNQSALARALTSRRCFQRSEEKPAEAYVALLLDTSGSMAGMEIVHLAKSARIINGALMQAKVNVRMFSFGGYNSVRQHITIGASEAPLAGYGGTPTHLAMAAAAEWLEVEQAQRSLVICVTDGNPDNDLQVTEQLHRLEEANAKTIGVLIGYTEEAVSRRHGGFQEQFNDLICTLTPDTLAEQLEPKLRDFILGL